MWSHVNKDCDWCSEPPALEEIFFLICHVSLFVPEECAEIGGYVKKPSRDLRHFATGVLNL